MHTRKFEISVGLPVYLEPTGNATRTRNPELIPGTISKIGRKYFYVTSDRSLWGGKAKFDKETFTCWEGDDNYGYRIYLKPEWYEQELDRIEKLSKMRNMLGRIGDELPYGVVCKMYECLMSWKEGSEEPTSAAARARWLKNPSGFTELICSNCGGGSWYYDVSGRVEESPFCPNCGARMDQT